MKKKFLLFIVVTLFSSLIANISCSPGTKKLNVVVQLSRKNLAKSSLLVFNFREPPHAAGIGAYIAERFHINLLKSKKFKVIGLYNNSPWSRLGETEEDRLLNALEECRDKKFDYILAGELKEFYDGGINQSRVYIKIRIIEVQSQITIFLAENYKESRGKDPSYPMATKLSKRSKHPEILAEKIIEEFIKKMDWNVE